MRPGLVISRDGGMPAAIAETRRVLAKTKQAPSTLYQPAFRVGDLAVIVDVLRRSGAHFELVEVKGTTQVKETHVPDAAFQAADEMRRYVALVRPDWPDADARAADLASHVALLLLATRPDTARY